MRQHTLNGIKFLLGVATTSSSFSKESPGFLFRLREKRNSSIEIVNNDTKITDRWHKTAFGFAGCGVETEGKKPLTMVVADPVTLDVLKAMCLPLYKETNMRYFDLCAQSYIEVAEKWQDACTCLVSSPLSPRATLFIDL